MQYARRIYRIGDIEYLLDEDDGTAWLGDGDCGDAVVFKVPDSIEIDGRVFLVTSVEMDFGSSVVKDSLRELIIPDSIEYIDEYAFAGYSIEKIHIGSGLEYLHPWSFKGASSTVEITISPDNPYIKMSDDGTCVLSKDGSTLYCFVKDLPDLTVPDGVIKIDSNAITCDRLERLSLPSSLRIIGNMGISGCQRLKDLVLPEGLEEIDTQGLSENRALKVVDLPSTLKVLDGEAFCNDNCLEKIIVRTEAPPTIPWYLAVGYTPVDTCRLIVPRHLVPAYRNHPQWGWFRHIVYLEDN